jgi:hypothetical protein
LYGTGFFSGIMVSALYTSVEGVYAVITGAFPGVTEVFTFWALKDMVQIARIAAPKIYLLVFILSNCYGNII